MSLNQTISFGNVTTPVDLFIKVDSALGGYFSIFLLSILFLAILGAYYKKYNSIERGMSIAGFVCAFLGSFLTVIGVLPWSFIWISVVFFIIGFLSKAFTN